MKFILAAACVYAVNAFGHRDLLSDLDDIAPPDVVRKWGGIGNTLVSEAEVQKAAEAAKLVYWESSCSSKTVKYGDWKCIKSEDHDHDFWFESSEAKIRFHYFESQTDNSCGFVFRGTDHVREWETNLNSLLTKDWFGEKAHAGFVNAFKQVEGAISYWLEDRNSNAQPYKPLKPACQDGVYFIGHSLGGALATVADIWFESAPRWNNMKATSITFGAPKVLKKKSNPKNYNEMRVLNAWDPVPSNFAGFMENYEHRGHSKVIDCAINPWPACGFTGACEEVSFEEKGAQAKSALSEFCSFLPNKGYHGMMAYERWVNAPMWNAHLSDTGTQCLLNRECKSQLCVGTTWSDWYNTGVMYRCS